MRALLGHYVDVPVLQVQNFYIDFITKHYTYLLMFLELHSTISEMFKIFLKGEVIYHIFQKRVMYYIFQIACKCKCRLELAD